MQPTVDEACQGSEATKQSALAPTPGRESPSFALPRTRSGRKGAELRAVPPSPVTVHDSVVSDYDTCKGSTPRLRSTLPIVPSKHKYRIKTLPLSECLSMGASLHVETNRHYCWRLSISQCQPNRCRNGILLNSITGSLLSGDDQRGAVGRRSGRLGSAVAVAHGLGAQMRLRCVVLQCLPVSALPQWRLLLAHNLLPQIRIPPIRTGCEGY